MNADFSIRSPSDHVPPLAVKTEERFQAALEIVWGLLIRPEEPGRGTHECVRHIRSFAKTPPRLAIHLVGGAGGPFPGELPRPSQRLLPHFGGPLGTLA